METSIRTAPVLQVPVEPDADQARDWLQSELSKPEYQEAQPGLLERALTAVLEWLADVVSGIQGVGASTGVLLLGLGALLLLALAVLIIRPRLNARRRPDGVFDDAETGQDAVSHRTLAEEALRAGDWDRSLAERLRAILRSAEERVILDPRPGRTAHEAGASLSAVFPAAAEEILWLSRRFDEVRYGGGQAAEQDARRAGELDARLLGSSPAAPQRTAQPSLAVPK